MGKPGTSHLKRAKEKERAERQQDKQARRAEARDRKNNGPGRPEDGTDPDIAGIVPGPQAPPEIGGIIRN